MRKAISKFRKIAGAFLVLITLAAIIFLATAKLNVPSDMFSLLPKENANPLKEQAFDHVSKEASQRIIILFGADNKNKSYAASEFFFQKISEIPGIEENQYHINSTDKKQLAEFYFPYRNQILSADFFHHLQNDQAEKISDEAKRTLYSPININDSSQLKEDPFFLSGNFLMNLPFLQTSLAPFQDILMSKYQENYYAFLALTLNKDIVFSSSDLEKTVKAIKKIEKETAAKFSDVKIILSGVPIHSYAGSQQGITEVNLIGWLSVLGILLLIYFTFRSIKPFFFAITSISVGFIVAFAATHLVFGEVHLLTIIFGTSLVGVSDDYSIHYFSEYLNQKERNKNSGMAVLNHIFPGITMGLITSILGYMALIFTPFPGLQQIAFFSTIGFSISYLIVILFFPIFYKPAKLNYRPTLLNLSNSFVVFFQKIITRKKAYYIFAALILLSLAGISKLDSSDNIRLLYSSPQELIDNEILVRKILQQNKAIEFFLIEGKTPQEVLEKEEQLGAKIDGLIAEKNLDSYQAISQIIPSVKRQEEALKLVKNELIKPHLKSQSALAGLGRKEVSKIQNSFNEKPQFLYPEQALENPLLKMMKPLWMGEVSSGNYASIMLLDNVKNSAALKSLSDENNGIYLLNKVEDISDIFTQCRLAALYLLIAVNFIIAILLIYRYGFPNAIFVFLPAVLAAGLTFALMGLINYQINLFNILALFLVLGVGIDYAIFYAEDKESAPTTSLAVVISSLTTLLSFSLLSFSSFNVIHSIGLTILFGILFSYLLSPFASLIHRKK